MKNMVNSAISGLLLSFASFCLGAEGQLKKPGANGSAVLQTSEQERVVADVVSHDDWGGEGKMFASKPSQMMRDHFSKAFVKDWARIAKAATQSPSLDGDILLGEQGISGVHLQSSGAVIRSPERSEVRALLRYFEDEVEGRPEKSKSMRFFLVKEAGVWKVDDFELEDKSATTAHTFRKEHHADHFNSEGR